MDSRHPAANATVPSASRSQPMPGDALCKVAFVDVDVAKVTPRTSCRSMASSDSDDSVTSSTTSSSRDNDDDELLPSSAATWTTYVYFYPRHDMTYTHCLLTTSRHVDCDAPSLTSAYWPSLTGEDKVPAGGWRPGHPGDETFWPGGDSRWRRRVNAARTPFWFPVARSCDTAAKAYLCYPRHDLSYAEVEASRIDRQPGVERSSLPFSTILEELTDDASYVDDGSDGLEDRKSIVDDLSDIASVRRKQLSCDDLRSTTSSLSECHPGVEGTQTALLPAPHRYNKADEQSSSVVDGNRRKNPRSQTLDTIMTPITKLDLKRLELMSPRQRVETSRTRTVVRGAVAEKVRVRRCVSDADIRSEGRQSPVRELPWSARTIKKKSGFSADGEDGLEDLGLTADGDQTSCCLSSTSRVIPLRTKQAVTCLLPDQQSFNNNSATASHVHNDVTISHRTCPCSVVISATMTSLSFVTTTEDQHQTNDSDQSENVDRSAERSGDLPATPTDDIPPNVRANITSDKMTSPDVTSSLVAGDLMMVDWSSTPSEYLTPPTRPYAETAYHTAAVAASATVTRVRDAMSQTPLDAELNCTEVQIVHSDHLSRNAGPPAPAGVPSCHPLRLEDSQLEMRRLLQSKHNYTVIPSPTFTRICDVTSPLDENTVHRAKIAHHRSPERGERVIASATVTRICNATSQTVDINDDQSTQPSHLHVDNNTVTDSLTVDRSPSFLTAGADRDAHRGHSAFPEQSRKLHAAHVKQTTGLRLYGDKKSGRESGPGVVEVGHPLSSSDLLPRQHLDHRRPSASTLRESRTAPLHRQPGRRPNIERIGSESLAKVGGLRAYTAALTPRNQDISKQPAIDHRVDGCRRSPSKSYVGIWRKRVATYEAFVNRCQTTTTTTGIRSQHCDQHRLVQSISR